MTKAKETSTCLTFEDNRLLPLLFGEHDKNLSKLEDELLVDISSRGNKVAIKGKPEDVKISEQILNELYEKLQKGFEIEFPELEATIKQHSQADKGKKNGSDAESNLFGDSKWKEMVLKTQKKHIVPFSESQARYLESILKNHLTFASGPAGTGKTYFAVAAAAHLFTKHEIERIILSRPAVEAGEKLGFLPGDMKEKVDPYLRPLYDALHDMMPGDKLQKHIANGDIEVAPLAFMRGRTLKHAVIILDEAQNVTPIQMKMFLTRMGEGSRIVVTGDMSQTDLPPGEKSGLEDAMTRLRGIEDVAFIEFGTADIVRHPLTAKIIEAYES